MALLEAGNSATARNKRGQKPLSACVKHKELEILTVLLKELTAIPIESNNLSGQRRSSRKATATAKECVGNFFEGSFTKKRFNALLDSGL